LLEAVGLGAVEESTYLELLGGGQATVTELANRTGLTVARTRRAVTGLHRKGLVHRTPPPHDLVVPVSPDLAVDNLIDRRHDELERVRETAQMLAAETHDRVADRRGDRLIEVVPARSGVLHAFERVQRTARREVRVLVAPPYVATSDLNQTQLDRGPTGIVYRSVYGNDALEGPQTMASIATHMRAGEQARLAHTVPIKLAIADGTLALLPLDWTSQTPDSAVLVYPCGLLDALAALFESIWALATPLRFAGPDGVAALAEISAQDQELLSLLVAGLTDEAAGARLGMSRRTVVRRVQHLMAITGARSRLQLGWRARERGWV
jgi:predicted transcriptional regulator